MEDILNFLKTTFDNTKNKTGNDVKSIIKFKIKERGEPVIYNWKVVMTLGIIVSILILGFFNYISPIVRKRFDTLFFSELYSFFLLAITYNLAQAIYTTTYYYYRMSYMGIKGPSGKKGKRGKRGKNTSCKIDKKYTSTFSFDDKPVKREMKVEMNIPPSILQDNNDEKYGWKKMDGTIGIRRFMSGNGRKCRTIPDDEKTGEGYSKCEVLKSRVVKNKKNETTNQPFNGVIIDVNMEEEKINSLQFFIDIHQQPSDNMEISLFDERYGSQKTKGTLFTVICPPNSALYKAQVLVSEDRNTPVSDNINAPDKPYDGPMSELKGIAFQCRDINTGNIVKLRNQDGKYRDRIYFGRNPTPNDKKYRYITAECGFVTDSSMKLKIPGFFSGVDMLSSKDQVYGLRFNQCSYYRAKLL